MRDGCRVMILNGLEQDVANWKVGFALLSRMALRWDFGRIIGLGKLQKKVFLFYSLVTATCMGGKKVGERGGGYWSPIFSRQLDNWEHKGENYFQESCKDMISKSIKKI